MNPVAIVKQRMRPLEPLPIGVEARAEPIPGIKAVIFDLYGTLIISAAGDISLVSENVSMQGMERALKALGGAVDDSLTGSSLQVYAAEIRAQQEQRRAEGVEYPEVEIREVWGAIAERAGLKATFIELAALEYECAVNPCWEMPGASDLLMQLSTSGLRLGIISNAQFYTHAVVAGLLQPGIEELQSDARLNVFSYEEREGKPSLRLFSKAAEAAGKDGIEPHEILYVGNDFRKDIEPASRVGFRTAFFAGDARSFRTGTVSPQKACDHADVVLTDLRQLIDVLGLIS
ncbi:MAG: HAD family hydrolase [Verrucomicrobiales bacterium]|nr:HAD family hydrolase [Verrucomicrobiales bacterium]